jgi:hypothetical protein
MQRVRTREPASLNAGDAGTLTDGRSFRVVDAVVLGDGRCEFLAVAAMTVTAAGTDDETQPAPVAGTAPVSAEALPLPYSLPT